MSAFTRRRFLSQSVVAGAALAVPFAARVLGQGGLPGRLLGTVPLSRPGAAALETLLGSGLDARLFTNLAMLTRDSLIITNDRFYVRTARPARLAAALTWSIRVGGLVSRPEQVGLAALRPLAQNMGTVLLECSGNSNPDNFGLISAADWRGVPMPAFLSRVPIRGGASTRVLVSGVDDTASASATSVPGASWIFTHDQLARSFLATEMNGAPLPVDHGAPVRLIVPGWYGCTCIKWVDQIDLVDDAAPATPHMREFAARTHQQGVPDLARDFLPASIDHAAIA